MADMGLTEWVGVIMMFFVPAAAYLHTVGAAPLNPQPKGVLSGRRMRWFLARIWLLLFFTGTCWAAAFLIYKSTKGSPLFLIPILFSVPTLVVESVIAMEARAQWAEVGKSPNSRRKR